jgi:radical SAM protein with 4Fe4S-binding SPASM domain
MEKKLIKETLQYRYENFGGIISSEDPPLLAFVDRNYMQELGLKPSPLWENPDDSIGQLSAPTEVHFAVTNQCSNGCSHCYMESGEKDPMELDLKSFKSALDILAEMGVFHIAMGGGEALERDDLFEIASYAREKGLVPNLTISGAKITPAISEKMHVFGQVNISIDNITHHDNGYRATHLFKIADQAIDLLIQKGVPTGINCVVSKTNFSNLNSLFKYAKNKKLNEIEFLRLKPSGRAKNLYLRERTTYEQNTQFIPIITRLSHEYNITAKIDCSFVPMYCYHGPPLEMLETIATYGCEAGNVLLGIKSNGKVSGCSFLEDIGITVFDLPEAYNNKEGNFKEMRGWVDRSLQPCSSCKYLHICKGGCHGVSLFCTGSLDNPDPDCPMVYEYQNKLKKEKKPLTAKMAGS